MSDRKEEERLFFERLLAEMEEADPQNKKLAQALVKKINSYAWGNWPKTKSLGIKLIPFIESKPIVFLLMDILKNKREEYSSFLTHDYTTYSVFIHIFLQYILAQKEDYAEIVTGMDCLVDMAIKTVVEKQRDDNRHNMLSVILKSYKAKNEPLLKDLFDKLSAVSE